MGMTYDEFWNDDVEKAKTYKQAFMLKKKQQNEQLWLQGMYIYKALERIFPLFNPWVEKEPMPYLEEPIPLSEEDTKEQQVNREKREMEKLRDYLELQVRKGEKKEG